MPGAFLWSSTASSNNTVDGISVATGMNAGQVDNALRAIMAVVRQTFGSALENFLAGTAALPIANGGTAATTAAQARTNLGALGSEFRDLPLFTQNAAFNFSPDMRSGGVRWTGAAATATIQPESSQPFALTTAIAVIYIYNDGTGALTITRGAGVSLKKNGGTSSADATLAVGGEAILKRISADNWIVTGVGVS